MEKNPHAFYWTKRFAGMHQGAWSGWLKEVAFSNIDPIYLTLDTFQLLSGWLKDRANANI